MNATTSRAPQPTGVVALIARREIVERMRSKGFMVLTALLVAIVLAVGVISRVAGSGGEDAIAIGVTSDAPRDFAAAATQAASLFDREVTIVPMTDGAACVLLASEEWAAKRGLALESFLTYSQSSANNFVAGEGLLMAPTIAVSSTSSHA